jgi:hypothetical protein
MKIQMKSILLVAVASLLASCETLTIPGETKASAATSRSVVSGIHQLEKDLYQCKPSTLVFKNTKFDHASSIETIEEWVVSSCAGDEHTYIVAFRPEDAGALVFHEKIDKSGSVTNSLWSKDGNIKNNYFVKETISAFDQKIDAARLRVLRESSETEAMLQKGKGEQYGGKHWLSLCDTPMLKFEAQRIGKSIQNGSAMQFNKSFESTHCYKWYGTRHDWKETVLKKGVLLGS